MTQTLEDTRAVGPPRVSFVESDGNKWLRRGETIGRYMVLELIGMGGMGRVYRAYDPELDRQVAVKLLRPGSDTSVAQDQLLEEARMTAKLTHPNVVVVHDTGTFGQHVFVAMELVEGQTLREWQEDGQRSIPEILRMFIAAGRGLAAAHAAGIVHLDFKPSNVVVGVDGRARVLDFGLATLAREDDQEEMGESETSSTFRGTPAYMPPEQHGAEPTDARADIYAFGASLWQAVYGTLPFFGNTHNELLAAKRKFEPMAPQDVEVPGWLQKAMRAAMAPDPKDRPASMQVVLDELESDPDTRRLRRIKVGLAALGLLSVGYAASLATQGQDDRGAPPPVLCVGATSAAAQVWTPELRQAAQASFQATGRPYAAATWTRVEAAMDDFVRRWATGRNDACADTRVRQEESAEIMDLRFACYDRKLKDAGAFMQLLADADAALVDNAASAAGALPSLIPCADPTLLRGREAEPTDPETRERIAAGQEQLRRVRALVLAGQPKPAEEAIVAGLEIAREVDFGPLLSALLVEKFRARGSEDAKARQRGLMEAAAIARRAGEPDIELEAWVEIMWSAGVFERNQELGNSAMAYAQSVTATSMVDPVADRRLGEARAALLATSGDLDGALLAQQRLVATLDQNATWSPSLVSALNNLGNIQSMRGELPAAFETYTRVDKVARQTLGAAHPITMRVRNNLAINRIEDGKAEQVIPELASLLEDKIEILGESHFGVAASRAMLGHAYYRVGKLDEARAAVQGAIETFREIQGPRGGGQVNALVYLAEIELKAGHVDAAEAASDAAIDIGEETMGADNPGISGAYVLSGAVHIERGRAKAAVKNLELGFQLEVKAGGEDAEIPELRFLLARALVMRGATGDVEAATLHLDKALSQFESVTGADADDWEAAKLLRARLEEG